MTAQIRLPEAARVVLDMPVHGVKVEHVEVWRLQADFTTYYVVDAGELILTTDDLHKAFTRAFDCAGWGLRVLDRYS